MDLPEQIVCQCGATEAEGARVAADGSCVVCPKCLELVRKRLAQTRELLRLFDRRMEGDPVARRELELRGVIAPRAKA